MPIGCIMLYLLHFIFSIFQVNYVQGVIFMVASFFTYIKCDRLKAISILIVLKVHFISLLICNYYNVNLVYIIIINFLFFYFTLYQCYKKYTFKSDKYDKRFIFLIFYKPKTIKQYLISLFGYPFAGMASIINGKVYKLTWDSGVIKPHELDIAHTKSNYYIVNTHVKNENAEEIIPELLQCTAYNEKLLNIRLNCVRSQRPLLNILGYKYKLKSFFDFLPSVYTKDRF